VKATLCFKYTSVYVIKNFFNGWGKRKVENISPWKPLVGIFYSFEAIHQHAVLYTKWTNTPFIERSTVINS